MATVVSRNCIISPLNKSKYDWVRSWESDFRFFIEMGMQIFSVGKFNQLIWFILNQNDFFLLIYSLEMQLWPTKVKLINGVAFYFSLVERVIFLINYKFFTLGPKKWELRGFYYLLYYQKWWVWQYKLLLITFHHVIGRKIVSWVLLNYIENTRNL